MTLCITELKAESSLSQSFDNPSESLLKQISSVNKVSIIH